MDDDGNDEMAMATLTRNPTTTDVERSFGRVTRCNEFWGMLYCVRFYIIETKTSVVNRVVIG